MGNKIELVRDVVEDLAAAGFEVAVFGGWTEQLLALAPIREHGDIDLLVFDPDLDPDGDYAPRIVRMLLAGLEPVR